MVKFTKSPDEIYKETDAGGIPHKPVLSEIRTMLNEIDAAVTAKPNRNAIINGAFDIWQRGTSFTFGSGSSGYSADRWIGFADTGSSVVCSRQAFTAGAAPVAGYESAFYHRIVNTSGGGASGVEQRIEDVRTTAGKTITISFWAKASTPITNYLFVSQRFGSGGSAEVAATLTAFSLTTAWQRFSYTYTVPSIAGKTVGSGSHYGVQLLRFLPSATVDIWGVQIEEGAYASAFEQRQIGYELSLCQRYYEKSFPIATAPAQNAGIAGCENTIGVGAGIYTQFNVRFKTPKRATPTLFIYNPSAASGEARNTDTFTNCSSTGTDSVSDNGFRIATITPAGSAIGNRIAAHWTADAEL